MMSFYTHGHAFNVGANKSEVGEVIVFVSDWRNAMAVNRPTHNLGLYTTKKEVLYNYQENRYKVQNPRHYIGYAHLQF